MSSSTWTKSKRERRLDKREKKIKNNQSPPLLSNDGQNDDQVSNHSSSVEILQKMPDILKELKEGQSKLISYSKFNQQSLQKYRKRSDPIKQTSENTNILSVQQNQQTISHNKQDSRPINYKKGGSKESHKTSEYFLKSRLNKIQEAEKQENGEQKVEDTSKPKPSQKQDQKEGQKQKSKPVVRYFDPHAFTGQFSDQDWDRDNDRYQKSIKCHRCGKTGHVARLCEQSTFEATKCMYCCGNHNYRECIDKICRNCCQNGHVKQDCKNKSSIRCHRCGNLGHIMKDCGKVIMLYCTESSKQQQKLSKFSKGDLQKLMCLKCNDGKGHGHYNCHEYGKKIPRIYQEVHVID